MGIMFGIVYWIFSEYREEDFQQRQKEKIITTLHFINEIEKDERELTEAVDRLAINSILNEKLLIFDSEKKLIYSSLDDVPIEYSDLLLQKLSEQNVWIEQKDGLYDVVAIHFKVNQKSYYGISKAFDELGYTKLSFLRRLLLIAFIVFTINVILISIYIARRISKPISELTSTLAKYKIGETPPQIQPRTNTVEIDFLNDKFNELLNRINNAYTFQKHSIQHISHQLKTPIAVLISELERMRQKSNESVIQQDIDKQISRARSLAEVMNTLLEISKIESGQGVETHTLRIDEVIFDCISELNTLKLDFIFEVNYLPAEPSIETLSVKANEKLIRQVFLNLLNNGIAYNSGNKVKIEIDVSNAAALQIFIINKGRVISREEENFLFTHFFRGENSRDKPGFGLGLTLTRAIVELHKGHISYSNPSEDVNVFTVQFPISLS